MNIIKNFKNSFFIGLILSSLGLFGQTDDLTSFSATPIIESDLLENTLFEASTIVEDSTFVEALLDSIVVHRLTPDDNWYKSQISQKFRNDKNLIMEETQINFSDQGVYMDGDRTLLAYSEKNEITFRTIQKSVSENTWTNVSRTAYYYNVFDLVDSTVVQTWQTNANDWLNNSYSTYAYNGTGEMTEKVNYLWNVNAGDWMPHEKQEITYVDLSEVSIVSNWVNDEWVNIRRVDNFFDDNNNSLGNASYEWDSNVGDWTLKAQNAIDYNDSNQLISQTIYLMNTSGIYYGQRYTFMYMNDLHAETVLEDFNASSQTWTNNARRLINRDPFENVLYRQGQNWDAAAADWSATNQTWDYYYDYVYEVIDTTSNPIDTTSNPIDTTSNPIDTTSNPIDTLIDSLDTGIYDLLLLNTVAVYPNPSNGVVQIKTVDEIQFNAILRVYNSQGKLVQTGSFANQMSIDLDSGIYFIELLNEEKGRVVQKVVVE